MTEVVACYRFVTKGLKSKNGDTQWAIGEWQKQEGELSLCKNGFHACLDPRDSLGRIFGERWFQAEARGVILHDDDKFCASEMRLVAEIPAMVIHQWMVDCAHRVLHLYETKYPDDKRPRLALEAKQAWTDDPSDENLKNLAAARDAAQAAARDAEVEWQRKHLRELLDVTFKEETPA